MHKKYMELALELARKGEGKVNPNPLVGAVIVKDGSIIGRGYHKSFGGNHGEIEAFNNCKLSAKGGIMYVNLEPCSHYGKTPPCVDRIIREGIKEIYIGMKDPNPKVSGKGINKLKQAGIKVNLGLLEEESRELNEVFINYIGSKKPYIILKSGMSLDGKIATKTGESMWITSEKSREHAHRLRNKYSAILVGIGTVIKDNPRLTCRVKNGIDPIRIIVDSHLRIPFEANVLKNMDKRKTIIGTLKDSNATKKNRLIGMGVEIIETSSLNGRVNLDELFKEIGKLGIDSILVEGGGGINYSILENNLANKLYLYIAPKIIGGSESKTFVEGRGINSLEDSFNFNIKKVKSIGDDIMIEAYAKG